MVTSPYAAPEFLASVLVVFVTETIYGLGHAVGISPCISTLIFRFAVAHALSIPAEPSES